jgi:hypothetical protein
MGILKDTLPKSIFFYSMVAFAILTGLICGIWYLASLFFYSELWNYKYYICAGVIVIVFGWIRLHRWRKSRTLFHSERLMMTLGRSIKFDWGYDRLSRRFSDEIGTGKEIYPKSVKDLSIGHIQYDVKEKMKVAVTERVCVNIAFLKAILEASNPEVPIEEINITRKVEVKLNADDKFAVTPLSRSTQIILDNDKTTWNWDVMPVKKGIGNLELVVSAAISTKEFGYEMKDIETFRKPITIKVNPSYSIKNFLSKNWQWIAGTAIGSGTIFSVLKALGVIK